MKQAIVIVFISMLLSGCIPKDTIDCSKIVDGELITEFKVSSVYLGEERFRKYHQDEEMLYDKLLELQAEQVGDTLVVKFYRMGGNAIINCVEARKSNTKIDVINYESNYLKEITIREIEYRIPNVSQLELGTVDFIRLSR